MKSDILLRRIVLSAKNGMKHPLVKRYLSTRINSSTFNPESKSWPVTCTFNPDCVFDRMKDIEAKWDSWLTEAKRQKNDKQGTRYILSMFPYPSGSLHLGHVKIYTSADVISRFYEMLGYNVVNPMGWDSFGLPAENAALERNLNPKEWTYSNIKEMRKQLTSLGIDVSWREATSDPSFYRWTQWLVLQLFKHHLLYKTPALVNWDPVDKTVLADDQVDSEGKSWRSGAVVQKRYLTQWFIKTSAFVNDLYEAEGVNRGESGINFNKILLLQQQWMGRPSGKVFYLPVRSSGNQVNDCQYILPVFTSCPEVFLQPDVKLLVSKDHWIASNPNDEHRVQFIHNPFSGKEMEIIVASSGKQEEILPSNFKATLFCSNPQTRSVSEAKRDEALIIEKCLSNESLGGYKTSSSYNDWLISRQRYWGTPIPIIQCKSCGPVAVPESDLPVVLPEVNDFQSLQKSSSKGSNGVSSKLQELAPKEWLTTKCPSCGSLDSVRETDTCDTFVDSSWYYLRYASEPSADKSFDSQFWRHNRVSLYLGGPEHANGHLITSRMIYHFLKKYHYLVSDHKEPFTAFLLQGIIAAKTYKDVKTGEYLTKDDVVSLPKDSYSVHWEKMSKSKGNGVNPNDLIQEYGREATRLTVMGHANLNHHKRMWRGSEEEFIETTKLLRKAMLTMDQFIYARQIECEEKLSPVIRRFAMKSNLDMKKPIDIKKELESLKQLRNESIVKVKQHFGHDFKLGRGSKKLQEFLYGIQKHILVKEVCLSLECEKCLGDWIIMMFPLTPCLSQELWSAFLSYANKSKLSSRYNFSQEKVNLQELPEIDEDHIIPISVQVDEDLFYVSVPREVINRSNEKEVRQLALKFVQEDQSLSQLGVKDWAGSMKRISLIPGLKAFVSFIPGIPKKSKKGSKKKKHDSDDEDDYFSVEMA